jgi:hypothetical protein
VLRRTIRSWLNPSLRGKPTWRHPEITPVIKANTQTLPHHSSCTNDNNDNYISFFVTRLSLPFHDNIFEVDFLVDSLQSFINRDSLQITDYERARQIISVPPPLLTEVRSPEP